MTFFKGMSDYYELLQLINILCTLSMCFRMLKVLSFQPKLGIVTQTLFIAASDLLHFSFLFFLLVAFFSASGYVTFGAISDAFYSYPISLNTCIQIFMGNSDVNEEMQKLSISIPWTIWYYSYLIIASFILLNVLLAIIVDAYVDVKERSSFAPSIMHDALGFLDDMVHRGDSGLKQLSRALARMNSGDGDGSSNDKSVSAFEVHHEGNAGESLKFLVDEDFVKELIMEVCPKNTNVDLLTKKLMAKVSTSQVTMDRAEELSKIEQAAFEAKVADTVSSAANACVQDHGIFPPRTARPPTESEVAERVKSTKIRPESSVQAGDDDSGRRGCSFQQPTL